MHKHVGQQLPWPEKWRKQMVKGESVGYAAYLWRKVRAGHHPIERELGHEDKAINDKQVLYYNRQYLETAGSELCHRRSYNDGSGLRSTSKWVRLEEYENLK
jgi:hypothetical protein